MLCRCCSKNDDIKSRNEIIFGPEPQEKNKNDEEHNKMDEKNCSIVQDENLDKETYLNSLKDS